MSVTEINETNFDVVIVGSTLSNCVLFASLARAGKKVALFEPQQWHGFTNASLALADYHRLVGNIQDNQQDGYYFCKVVDDRAPKGKSGQNGPEIDDSIKIGLDNVIKAHFDRATQQKERIEELSKEFNRKLGIVREMIEKAKEEESEEKIKEEVKEEQTEEVNEEIKEENQDEENNPKKALPSTCPDLKNLWLVDLDDILSEILSGKILNDDDVIKKKVFDCLVRSTTHKTLTGSLPDQTTRSEHIFVPFPSYLPLLKGEKEEKRDFFYNVEKSNEKSNEKSENEEQSGSNIPLHIKNDVLNNTFNFPLHNAYEYVADSNLPLSLLLQLNNDQNDTKNTETNKIEKNTEHNEESVEKTEENTEPPTPPPKSPAQLQRELIQLKYLQFQSLLKRNGYRYMVDLAHQEIYASSLAIKSIVEAKLHEYHEFRAVNKTSLLFTQSQLDGYQSTNSFPGFSNFPGLGSSSLGIGSIGGMNLTGGVSAEGIVVPTGGNPGSQKKYISWEVPYSQKDIMVDTRLSLRAKNRLTVVMTTLLLSEKASQYDKDMFNAYKKLPFLNMVFHICNPDFVSKELGQNDDKREQQCHTCQSSQINTDSSSSNSSALGSMYSLGSSLFSTTNAVVSSLGYTTASNNNLINPLTTLTISDLKTDPECLLIASLLSSGISQHLPPCVRNGGLRQVDVETVSWALRKHLASVGRYSNSAFLYPMYGIGEISQAWIYNACVWGGLGVIRMGLAGIIIPKNYHKSFWGERSENGGGQIGEGQIGEQVGENTSPISLFLQSGQLINTKALICDRILSPFDLNTLSTIQHHGLRDDSNISDEDDGVIKIESKDDNLVQPIHVTTALKFQKRIVQNVNYRVFTSQRIVLIVDSLPRHFNQSNLPLHEVSIQTFIIPRNNIEKSVPEDAGFIKNGADGENGEDSEDSEDVKNCTNCEKKLTPFDLNNASSKVFIAEESVGLSTNDQYMIFITTTLFDTIVNDVNDVHTEYQSQLSKTNSHYNVVHDPSTAFEDKGGPSSNYSPHILKTLPQLQPFFNFDQKNQDQKVDTDHIHYISSYCYTTVTPKYPEPLTPASAITFTSVQPRQCFDIENKDNNGAIYPNIFITSDMNQSQPTVEDSFIQASHLYYAYMNYGTSRVLAKNGKIKVPILPFLMTNKEAVIDDEVGEVLQRLEDRNPQLAHVGDVFDKLEQDLANMEETIEETIDENVTNQGNEELLNSPESLIATDVGVGVEEVEQISLFSAADDDALFDALGDLDF